MIKETRTPIKIKPVTDTRPASDAKQDFEYARCGIANIFLASGPLTGKRYVEVTKSITEIQEFDDYFSKNNDNK